jgi:plasmid stabilization system protein ParE
LIVYTPRATRQIAALVKHYEDRRRLGAIDALFAALDAGERQIENDPASGLAAPRPYPLLARPGRAWIKAGRYWIAYRTRQSPAIVAIFYETADIPNRL